MRQAIIKSGKVENVIEGPLPGAVDCGPDVAIGWNYDGTLFSAPALPLSEVRRLKIGEIEARRDADISAKLGIDAEDMGMLKVIYQNTDPAFHTTAMTGAYDIWAYAEGKITQAKTATLKQLNGYDVAMDTSWPVV